MHLFDSNEFPLELHRKFRFVSHISQTNRIIYYQILIPYPTACESVNLSYINFIQHPVITKDGVSDGGPN